MLTMILGGLWHGANWTFVLWGALHGAMLILQRRFRSVGELLGFTRPFMVPVRMAVVFVIVCFGWILFRSPNFSAFARVCENLFSTEGWSFDQVPQKYLLVKGLGLVGLLAVFDAFHRWLGVERVAVAHPAAQIAFIAGCGVMIVLFGTFSGNAFIYFQF